MAVRLAALLPRAVIVALVVDPRRRLRSRWPPTTRSSAPRPQRLSRQGRRADRAGRAVVNGQAYVFAKGILEDPGFAWRVVGSVHGFAANRVVIQCPAAGHARRRHRRADVVLRLVRGPYRSTAPDDVSPYRGTAIRLAGLDSVVKPAAKPHAKPAAKPKPARKAEGQAVAKPAAEARARTPAFVVAGAPQEPLDEMPLRPGLRLQRWVANRRRPAPNVQLLALPARLDRHRRPVRLVARRPGSGDADRRRPAGRTSVGHRRQERGRRPGSARPGPSPSRDEHAPPAPRAGLLADRDAHGARDHGRRDGEPDHRLRRGLELRDGHEQPLPGAADHQLALDKMRREIHCASVATPTGSSPSVTITLPSYCKTGSGSITWCTRSNGTNALGAYRVDGALTAPARPGTPSSSTTWTPAEGTKIFDYTAPPPTERSPTIQRRLPGERAAGPSRTSKTYKLHGTTSSCATARAPREIPVRGTRGRPIRPIPRTCGGGEACDWSVKSAVWL